MLHVQKLGKRLCKGSETSIKYIYLNTAANMLSKASTLNFPEDINMAQKKYRHFTFNPYNCLSET